MAMHICFLCHEYPPGQHGGVGSFTQTIGRALVARGHQITVIGAYPPEKAGVEYDEGVHVVRLPQSHIPRTGFIINGRRLRRALSRIYQEHPIDILEGPNSSLAVISHSCPVPKIMRMHGGHKFFTVTIGRKPIPWRSWLEAQAISRADFLCSVSKYNADVNRALLELGNRPVEVLPNPVDTEFFRPRPGIPEDEGLILYAGTMAEKKGVRQLVQAIPRVLEAVPGAHLWLVGRDWQDPYTGKSFVAELRRLIAPTFEQRIVFKAPVERMELPSLLARAQICVFPSLMEAHPVAWLEALAAGKPMVASETGPGPEVVEDGVSGLMCNPYEPASIADKLIRLLKEPSLRRWLGEQARKRAVEKFSIETIVEQNVAFYQRCLQTWEGTKQKRSSLLPRTIHRWNGG